MTGMSIWKVAAKSNRNPLVLVTGRDKKIRYRYIQTDAEERYIKNGQRLVFQTLNEINKKAGLWRGSYNSDNPIDKQLLPIHSDDDYSISQLIKSKNTEFYTLLWSHIKILRIYIIGIKLKKVLMEINCLPSTPNKKTITGEQPNS